MFRLPPRKYQRRLSPERIAKYLYKMIIRKDNKAPGYRFRIEAEVELIKKLSRKVYNKLRNHREHIDEWEENTPRYVITRPTKG